MSSVDDCSLLALPVLPCGQGHMAVVENGCPLPFPVRRAFYLYDISDGSDRGEHAHQETYQFLVAARGSFEVILDDGCRTRVFTLANPGQGLLVVPGIWNTLRHFSPGAVCLVLTSHGYDAADYIRDYGDFLNYKKLNS